MSVSLPVWKSYWPCRIRRTVRTPTLAASSGFAHALLDGVSREIMTMKMSKVESRPAPLIVDGGKNLLVPVVVPWRLSWVVFLSRLLQDNFYGLCGSSCYRFHWPLRHLFERFNLYCSQTLLLYLEESLYEGSSSEGRMKLKAEGEWLCKEQTEYLGSGWRVLMNLLPEIKRATYEIIMVWTIMTEGQLQSKTHQL